MSVARRVRSAWPALAEYLGFAVLTYASWEVHRIAGLFVGGAVLLFLSFTGDGSDSSQDSH